MSIPSIDLAQSLQNFSLISESQNPSSSFHAEEIRKIIQDLDSKSISLEEGTTKYHHWMKELNLLLEQNQQRFPFAIEKLNCLLDLNNKLGIMYQSFGEYRKAIEFYEKDLQIAQNLKNQSQEKWLYGILGVAYQAIGEYPKVIECYENYLQIALEQSDRISQEWVYGNLFLTYQEIKEYRKAIDYQEKALSIIKDREDRIKESESYIKIGNSYSCLYNYLQAIKYYEKSIQIAIKTGNLEIEQSNYNFIRINYQFLGEYRKAIDYGKKALSIAIQRNDAESKADIYIGFGNCYYSLGDYRKAIKYQEKSIQIFQEQENGKKECGVYNNLGISYYAFGEYRKAIECYEKSILIAKELGQKNIEGLTYGNIGNAYYSMGEYRKAINYQEQSLKIARETGNKKEEGNCYTSLGLVYQDIGEYRRAIDFYEKSLEISIELKLKASEALIRMNLGNGYYFLKLFQQSIKYHEESLKTFQEIGDRGLEGRSYTNMGVVYENLMDSKKAIECYEKSLKISQEIKDHLTEGMNYSNLGISYFSISNYQKAIEYHEKSRKICQEMRDRVGEAISLRDLALVHESLKNFSVAESFFLQSATIYSKVQHELGDNTQGKISIFENQSESYMGLEGLFFKQGKIIQALEVTEDRRARALVSSIENKFSGLEKNASIFSFTFNQIQKISNSLQTNFIIYSLSNTGSKRDKKYTIKVWVISSQGEISSYQLPWNEKLSFDEISNQLQSLVKEVENLSSIKRGGSDELDFDLDELDLEAELALLNTDPEVEKLATSKQAEKKEKDQEALKQLKENYLTAWYDLLIAPLEKALPSHGSSITIIPDGVLSQFPFGAFCDKQGTYLIEKYAISLAPSIKTLQLLHQLPQEFPSTSLIVGSPDTGRSLDYLEVADREALAVSNLVEGSKLLSKKQATISHVSQQMQEARFIHLACHGLAEKKYDKHSVFEGLFKLAPDEEDPEPKPEHGHLYAQQIAALNLKAELVFLSACYSGKGNVKQEGSIGPVWSFLGAGAKSTVATYWPLPDSATTFEMVESFYQGILNTDRASLNKAQVLRQVTLKAMEKNRDDFIQWGAFFLSGVSIDAKVD